MSGSPSPATGVAWNVAVPDNSQPHGGDFNEHRETKLAVGIRMTKEHVAFAAASAGGEHKEGSANIYVGDYSVSAAGDALPTTKPDGSTALDTNDKGRLAYDTDAVYGGVLYKWSGTAWVQFMVSLLGAQTVTGVKTFSSFPVTPSSAPTTDYQVANKKYVDDLQRRIVQVVNVQSGSLATGTTVMPSDDTIPQISEGDQFMSLAITPVSATNKLKIEVVAHLSEATGGNRVMTAALFKNTDADALACSFSQNGTTYPEPPICFTHYMTAGTTDEITFKVRAGADGAGTTTFNGVGGARKYGGVMASSITITEIRV